MFFDDIFSKLRSEESLHTVRVQLLQRRTELQCLTARVNLDAPAIGSQPKASEAHMVQTAAKLQ